jgi:hypothetical protein
MSDKIQGLESLNNLTDEQLDAAIAEPASSNTDLQGIQNSLDDYKKYGDSELETALGSAASSATVGLSDQFLTKTGIYKPEELKKLREQNPISSGIGEVVGVVAPIIATGGTSLAAKGVQKAGAGVLAAERAGLAAEKVSEKLLSKVLQETGSKKLSKEIVKKSIAKGIGSSVEGAAYGAGQLIREDALGDAEFNADNLLAHMGGGALLGAGLGAGLGVAGAVGKAAANKMSGTGGQLAKKYLNPQRDAQKLFGFTDKDIIKNPKLMDEVIDYSKTRLGMNVKDSLDDILTKNSNVKSAAIKDLDDIYDQVADHQIGKSSFYKIADSIDEKFLKPYQGMKPFRSAIKPVKELVEELRGQAEKGGFLSLADLRKYRQKIDILAKEHFDKLKPSMKADAAFDARNLIRDELNSAVAAVNPELGLKLKQANRDFYLAEKIEKVLDKKILKNSDAVSFKDLVLGGVLTSGFGIGGLAVPALNKFVESDLKRKISILSNMERFNKASESKIAEGIKGFFKKAGSSTKKVTIYNLADSPVAHGKDKPKDRKEAYKNTLKNIVSYQTEPEKFVENITKDLMHIERAAPQAAKIMAARATASMDFLASKLPRDMKSIMLDKPFGREYQPSTMELAKFERYVQIVDNPLSIVEELENGTITKEHAEALRAVYPNMYQRLQVAVLDEVHNHPEMSYGKKLQLGLVMDIPTDESLIPANVLALQSNFEQPAPPEPQGAVSSTQSGVSKLKISERQATDMQATQERKRT